MIQEVRKVLLSSTYGVRRAALRKLGISLAMYRALYFSSRTVADRRGVHCGAHHPTWDALVRRGLVEIPGRFGKCWSVTDAGLEVLRLVAGPTVNASGGAA